jgi:hypothetical protein
LKERIAGIIVIARRGFVDVMEPRMGSMIVWNVGFRLEPTHAPMKVRLDEATFQC